MRRRDFVAGLGSAAVAWPLAGRAQQADRARRVGVLMGYAEGDPLAKVLLTDFAQALSEFGCIKGRNLRMDVRWAPGNTDLMRTCAKELGRVLINLAIAGMRMGEVWRHEGLVV
jgi:putative ABC transport system substrate-binding protein